MLNVTLGVLGIWVLNAILGAGILATIDDKQRLLKWYESAPNDLCRVAVLTFWPVVALMWYSE